VDKKTVASAVLLLDVDLRDVFADIVLICAIWGRRYVGWQPEAYQADLALNCALTAILVLLAYRSSTCASRWGARLAPSLQPGETIRRRVMAVFHEPAPGNRHRARPLFGVLFLTGTRIVFRSVSHTLVLPFSEVSAVSCCYRLLGAQKDLYVLSGGNTTTFSVRYPRLMKVELAELTRKTPR
jgi:hypothetical protein